MITPGPWIYGKRSDGSIWLSLGERREPGEHWQGDFFGKEADARLIAAAPDLLEALKDIDFDERGDVTSWPNQLRVWALIAKAEGR